MSEPLASAAALNEYICRMMRPAGAARFVSSMADAWLVVERMRRMGSSVIINWGEDTELWEVDWITSGKRYTGIAKEPALAICQAFYRGTQPGS